jgi:uncharacterized protein involved in type VI secretion and phage assembly
MTLQPTPLDRPDHYRFGTHLGKVVSVDDSEMRGRVQVRLYDHDDVGEQNAAIWARVAVPFAGAQMGAFFIPGKDDEVLVSFVNGDPRLPIVVGGLWNGNAMPPEQLGGDGKQVDRWTIVGKQGTRIAIEEAQGRPPKISFQTPGGVKGTLSDENGGQIELKAQGSTVTIDGNGVSVETSGNCKVNASQVNVSASMVSVDAGMSEFSGTVQCNTLIATTVVSGTYTTGAGNIL